MDFVANRISRLCRVPPNDGVSFFRKLKNALPRGLKDPLRRGLWRQLALEWRLNSGVLVRVASHADWVVHNELFVDGEYDLPIRRVLEEVRSGPVVIADLGANIGCFGLRVADLARRTGFPRERLRLEMVEGAPTVFAELRERWERENPIVPGAVRLHHGLVGERRGAARLAESHVHFGNTVGEEGVVVPYLDLEQLFADVPVIHLLKCDIEGSEVALLRNYASWLAKAERIAIEFHHDKLARDEGCRLLAAAGFGRHELLRESVAFSVHYFAR